jgi:acyl-CoA thioesterase FadM
MVDCIQHSVGNPATSEVQCQYLDRSTPQRWLSALLVYADTAQFGMWYRFPAQGRTTESVLRAMHEVQEHALMRLNRLVLAVPHGAGLFAALKAQPLVTVKARVCGVGRSSYTMAFTFHSGGGDGRLLATLVTVMVATDAATHTRAAPIEHAKDLQDLISPWPFTPYKVPFVRPPAGAATWSSVVRATDCDSYGHINNALHPLLCEEARAACANDGRYTTGSAAALATAPPTGTFVSYSGQARGLQPYEIASHEVDGAFHFEMRTAEGVFGEVIVHVARGPDARL